MISSLFLLAAARAQSFSGVDFSGLKQNPDLVDFVNSGEYEVPVVRELSSEPAKNSVSKAAKKDWTVMIYINAKNDLESAALVDFNEMETVGSTGRVNFVAELGRSAQFSADDGNWTGARRYLISKDTDTTHISSPVLQSFDDVNMGDWRHLAEFMRWARQNFPAERYALIIWNHGCGWNDAIFDDYLRPQSTRGISLDVDAGSYIATRDMGRIFKEGGSVDLYAADACLMQMAEILAETEYSANIIVGSEDVEPGDGYDYAAVFSLLAARPDMTDAELAQAITSSYASYFTPQQKAVTMSAVNTKRIKELSVYVRDFAASLMANESRELVQTGIAGTLSFYVADYKDLYDFAETMNSLSLNPAVRQASGALAGFIKDKLVYSNATVGSDFQRAGGVSVYLPLSGYLSSYDGLPFAVETGWGEFLKWVGSGK
ncbi:MAG: clostripain-related cysteine peptidase [Elusimicrobiaceae bacterium]